MGGGLTALLAPTININHMELSEVEKFAFLVLRHFDFLRKYGYDFTSVVIYGRDPYLVLKNKKLKIEVIFTYLGKFDIEIKYVGIKFLKTNVKTIYLSEIILKSGYKQIPYIQIEDSIKWVSELLKTKFNYLFTNSKPKIN